MISRDKACSFCGVQRPRRRTHCPHCGRPSDFPNVEDAASPDEASALRLRYDAALAGARARGCEPQVRLFEEAVALRSQAVFACPLSKLMLLATGLVDFYPTYHQMAELRILAGPSKPGDPDWDVLRPETETPLFGEEFKKSIHHAALTLDGSGLSSYGECTVLLRESMIAHRASVFDENSILFMKHHGITIFDSDKLPCGFRAVWSERGRLAAAKLAHRIDAHTTAGQLPKILIRPGSVPLQDDFIEVHVFGSLTPHSFERVFYSSSAAGKTGRKHKRSRPRRGSSSLGVLKAKLAEAGADFELRP